MRNGYAMIQLEEHIKACEDKLSIVSAGSVKVSCENYM